MDQDTVTTNYNNAGTIIMEMIYADDFLSPGAAGTTNILIELSGIDDDSTVLDIGSGLGGSAFCLAEQKNCSVHGIDLMELNVAEANRRAASRGLSGRVGFAAGDATSLPFANECFQVVWGQDAWCHVEDKRRLISESFRVLVPGGLIVFHDWLLLDRQSSRADEIRRIMASPNIGDVQMYLSLLEERGFELEGHIDTSVECAAGYRDVIDRLHGFKAEICDRFGQRVFDIVLSKQQLLSEWFVAGVLGTGAFAARKAEDQQ